MLRLILIALILLTGAPAFPSDGYVDAVLNLGPKSPFWKEGIAKLGDQHQEELLDYLNYEAGKAPRKPTSAESLGLAWCARRLLMDTPPGDPSLLARRVATRMADLETTPCVWYPDVLLAARRHCLYKGQQDPLPAILGEWISTGEEPRQLAALGVLREANLPTSSSLPLLEKTLASSHTTVVEETLRRIEKLGAAMAPLAPKIIPMLGITEGTLRVSARQTLYAGFPATLPDLLIASTSADDPTVRGYAISVIDGWVQTKRDRLEAAGYTIEELGKIAAPWLATQLDCEGSFASNPLRYHYGQLLGRLGRAGNQALCDVVMDPNNSVTAKDTALNGLANAVGGGTLPEEFYSFVPTLVQYVNLTGGPELAQESKYLEKSLATRAAKSPPQ